MPQRPFNPGIPLRIRPEFAAVGLICTLALVIRLAFSQRVMVFATKDSFEYFHPAYDLVNGLGFELALRRPPIYPLFMSGVMAVFGQNLQAIAFTQHLLGVATVFLSYVLARLVFGRMAAIGTGLLMALNSVLIIHEHYILSESLFTLVLLTACLAFVKALRQDQARWYLLAGLLLGLAVLTRPVAQVVLLLVPFGVLIQRGSLRRALKPALLVILAAVLLVLPWMVRNKLSFGSFSVSGSGRFLSGRVVKHDRDYVFDHPSYQGAAGSLGKRAREIFQNEADERPEPGEIYSRYRRELGLSEAEADDLLRQIAQEAIARRPQHYIATTATMFLDLFASDQKEELVSWHLRERNQERLMNQWQGMSHLLGPPTAAQLAEHATAERLGTIYRPTRWLTPLVVGILLALVAGLWHRKHRPALFLGAIVGLVLLVSAAMVGEVPRYRYPLDPLISVLAAGGYATAGASLAQGVRAFVGSGRWSRATPSGLAR